MVTVFRTIVEKMVKQQTWKLHSTKNHELTDTVDVIVRTMPVREFYMPTRYDSQN